jgi:hypothetical protein
LEVGDTAGLETCATDGFDGIPGNPPWEGFKPIRKEFAARLEVVARDGTERKSGSCQTNPNSRPDTAGGQSDKTGFAARFFTDKRLASITLPP